MALGIIVIVGLIVPHAVVDIVVKPEGGIVATGELLTDTVPDHMGLLDAGTVTTGELLLDTEIVGVILVEAEEAPLAVLTLLPLTVLHTLYERVGVSDKLPVTEPDHVGRFEGGTVGAEDWLTVIVIERVIVGEPERLPVTLPVEHTEPVGDAAELGLTAEEAEIVLGTEPLREPLFVNDAVGQNIWLTVPERDILSVIDEQEVTVCVVERVCERDPVKEPEPVPPGVTVRVPVENPEGERVADEQVETLKDCVGL